MARGRQEEFSAAIYKSVGKKAVDFDSWSELFL